MDTVLHISLWGQDVAAVVWNKENAYATLEFYESFAGRGWDIAPLTMPLDGIFGGDRIFSFPSHRGKTFKGLPGLLADSLPDDYGNRVLDAWFASKGISDFSPLDRLCYIGQRGMGALEYAPARHDKILDASSMIEIEQLMELAREVLNKREAFCLDIQKGDKAVWDILKVGTSAGGAKPKAIIAFNEQTKEVRSGQVKAPEGFTYWLLKFDGVEDRKLRDNPKGIGRIEYAYYGMAKACGIQMMESRLLEDGPYAHFMTKRFDRTDSGEKLHSQTLCALAHFDRDERYAYEQIFQVMRRLHLPYPDMEQMFRRMVFNVVARNHDDHTKNHSFIMSREGAWSLAPAYDLCYAYAPSGKWTSQHQLSLHNKRDDFSAEDLYEVAKNMGIRKGPELVQEMVAVVSQWPQYAKEAGVPEKQSRQIQNHLRLLV